ncbi:MAG: hypothetical protein J6V72_00145, partial [Kiritimatiellae bacterium]|nr:hypothetical protein [Kiritimatiellia bacterium]
MSADSSTTNKFAVVGPTQSGKTCLAVGLFATNASNFTIEPVDTDGSSYLMDLKGCIAEGKWPGTTNKGTKKEIRFDFVKKGKKPIRVAFWEFGGETLASDETFKQFVNEHLTKLSGVVLLVNPGADAFQSNSPGLFEDTMLQYKKVLSFLRDENNGSHKAFVALTVTAADRLTGDLKGKLQSFDQCVEELSNTLTVSGFRWERFDVTVTGPLKEQDKPELAKGRVNSAASPFLWLLDKLHWLPRRQVIFRKIRRVALAVGVLAALAGAWCGVDAWNDYGAIQKNENELRAAIAKWSDKNNPSDDDLGALRTPLVALKNHKGWFRKKAVASANAFEPEIWNVHEKRIRREWSGIAGEPEEYGGDCDRVDRVFNAWVPSVPKVA